MGLSLLHPKLQNDKKLPKRISRAKLGQVVGFSRQHSSTVAFVRNLHTGYISSQYDVFSTSLRLSFPEENPRRRWTKYIISFSMAKENTALKRSMAVMESMDEVWLSEPERCDRQDALPRQRQITRRRAELRSKEIKQQDRRDPVPASAESDVDSDDDSQLDGSRDDAFSNQEEEMRQTRNSGQIIPSSNKIILLLQSQLNLQGKLQRKLQRK